jgi:16S rRNA (cytosine1402-N4)-methyltransferase
MRALVIEKQPFFHLPVMAAQAVDWIAPSPEGRYVDATVGLGGHTLALLQAGAGHVLALDRDADALDRAQERIEQAGLLSRTIFVHARYRNLANILVELGWGKVQGVLLDAGVSSMQLDDPGRGFSFAHDGPLDMRMDKEERKGAADVVNTASEQELIKILREYGQEPMAGRIARHIVMERQKSRIETTDHLAGVVKRAYPRQRRARSRNHPATKTFQALRIAVNQELDDLQSVINALPDILVPGGRAVVIAFHSLEDRIVKHTLRRLAKGCLCPPEQPVCTCEPIPRIKILTKKPLLPGLEEMQGNPRSRSAKMRVAQALGAKGATDE